MTGTMRMNPLDAQMFWLSSRIGNDQFLVYGFDGVTDSAARVRELLLARAGRIAELRLRVWEVPRHLDYPYWVGAPVDSDQVRVHPEAGVSWVRFLDALAARLTDRLDAAVAAWRVWLFADVRDAPGCAGPAGIAVLQVSHALVDGRGAAALARKLFQPDETFRDGVSELPVMPRPWRAATAGALRLPGGIVGTVWRGLRAERARARLAELAERGEVPPEVPGRPLISVNRPPGERRCVRMIVLPVSALARPAGVTVTVAVLAAVGPALARREPTPPSRLGAEVAVANSGESLAHNNFGNVGVELYPAEPDPIRRMHLIAAALAERRRRADHPLQHARRAVTAGLPAPAMWQEIAHFPLDVPPPSVTGNTVVSSVHRGPADLVLGGGRVRFTAGCPALSPAMSLTHGIHGIGDTVTITLTAGPTTLPDLDPYTTTLKTTLTTPHRT